MIVHTNATEFLAVTKYHKKLKEQTDGSFLYHTITKYRAFFV